MFTLITTLVIGSLLVVAISALIFSRILWNEYLHTCDLLDEAIKTYKLSLRPLQTDIEQLCRMRLQHAHRLSTIEDALLASQTLTSCPSRLVAPAGWDQTSPGHEYSRPNTIAEYILEQQRTFADAERAQNLQAMWNSRTEIKSHAHGEVHADERPRSSCAQPVNIEYMEYDPHN